MVPSSRVAFGMFSAALAVGVLTHEWLTGQQGLDLGLSGVFAVVTGLAALAVLLAPTSVPRVMGLFGLLAVELVVNLPDPRNHAVLVGIAGGALVVWWLLQYRTRAADMLDSGVVYPLIAPFLRVAFITTFFLAAFAKLNSDFFDATASCAVWIVESIPLMSVPQGLRGMLLVGAVVLEFAIPVLLLSRRTRGAAIVLGFGFHLVSAAAGHTAFSALAWAFYLLFLPPATLSRAVALVRVRLTGTRRRRLAEAARTPLLPIGLGLMWVGAVAVLYALPAPLAYTAMRWGAAFPYFLYAAAWAWLLLALRRHWLPAPGEGVSLQVRHVVLVAGLALLVLNAASPYLGLKTKYSLTMFSNLQTEPGHWNHLVVPESVRVFDWQDGGLIRFEEISDPELTAMMEFHAEGGSLVLTDARRHASRYPDATIRYTLDGVPRVASPVRSDPMLGTPLPWAYDLVAGFRPVVDDNHCLH